MASPYLNQMSINNYVFINILNKIRFNNEFLCKKIYLNSDYILLAADLNIQFIFNIDIYGIHEAVGI
ncbi:hypothetical protein D7V32_03220 [Acinetobacter tianfuensis]|uniref:Uncharacterized protein n=1 Tax=Acinetobacter tianfuensis TaxID=2419603 RepID=A0A3A8ERX5_9GAMM|nr:hypothetical protein D7V32_03220 [Acinetobacter tianfuensis]